ncbi:hypothetical protein FSP39_001833 [Pinctada imbricata]|uniref:Uncharacterized protein n=1 Tax=Pinctada imbricata TaxID=66713 RepID=A0AA88YA88_PINIB|nr:hypothetical protein FSP39_001833 [Pinctada imbricata]
MPEKSHKGRKGKDNQKTEMSLPPIITRPLQQISKSNTKHSDLTFTNNAHSDSSSNSPSPRERGKTRNTSFKLPMLVSANIKVNTENLRFGSSNEQNNENGSPVHTKRPETTDFESPTFDDRVVLNKSPGYDGKVYDLKLPQILVTADETDKYKQYMNKWKRARKLNELKRTESTYEYYAGSPSMEAKLLNNQLKIGRSHTHTAFLMPIGFPSVTNTSSSKMKKKKKKIRSPHKGISKEEINGKSPDGEEYSSDSPVRYSRLNHSSFEKILEESESGLSRPCSSNDSVVSLQCDSV